ncbi:MAG TPA: hypothetical protein VGD08_13730 [Stellaceae bacterium]|jgi:hypothetical protein
MARPSVVVGQRYRAVDFPIVLWEVIDLLEGQGKGAAHACLALVGDPKTTKTIACGRLLDRRNFLRDD